MRLTAFQEGLRRLGIDGEDLAQHLNAFYLERRFSCVDLYDDVIPTLEDLAADHNIGLLSNGSSYPDRVELQRYFGAAVFSQDVGAEKPDPAIYRAAQEALPGDRYIMVGDSLTNDVIGAQSAGWRGVWLNRAPTMSSTGRSPTSPSGTPSRTSATSGTSPKRIEHPSSPLSRGV
ncbi:MAG TPA: HAD family hydrolase [Nocardioidaceae bacterium]